MAGYTGREGMSSMQWLRGGVRTRQGVWVDGSIVTLVRCKLCKLFKHDFVNSVPPCLLSLTCKEVYKINRRTSNRQLEPQLLACTLMVTCSWYYANADSAHYQFPSRLAPRTCSPTLGETGLSVEISGLLSTPQGQDRTPTPQSEPASWISISSSGRETMWSDFILCKDLQFWPDLLLLPRINK